MFVPKTEGGRLLNMLQTVEDNLQMCFQTKLVEKPGTPLYMQFSKSFPISLGCQRGLNCLMCENTGTSCTMKGVVYKATCLECTEDSENNAPETEADIGVYIGETSRHAGTRALEHVNNMSNFRKNSFIIQHWMQSHGLQAYPPRFKFEILSSHKDALSRQLCEALHIRNKGNLNRKTEFALNEIIRMETTTYSWEQSKLNKKSLDDEGNWNKKLENFISVMSNVIESFHDRNTKKESFNGYHCYRSNNNKRSSVEQGSRALKRMKSLQTSTPLNHRNPPKVLEESPVRGIQGLGDSLEIRHHSDSAQDSVGTEDAGKGDLKTGVSGDLDQLEVTPPRVESDLVKVARNTVGLREHWDSHESFKKRSELKKHESVGMEISDDQVLDVCDEMEVPDGMLEEDIKFKCFDDDSKSFEISEIMLIDGMDDLYLEHLFAEVEQAPDVLGGMDDLHLERLFAEVEQDSDPFGEEHINPGELADEINERTRNKLYGIFIKPGLQLPRTPLNPLLSTPTKRKRSPGQQSESPSLRQRLNLCTDQARKRTMSVSVGTTPKVVRKRRTFSMGMAESNKITHHFKPAPSSNVQAKKN